jgi:AcrR family transcriptional regulator
MLVDTSTLDARQMRSRVALHDALERLIEEQGLDAITISTLAKEAEVGRPVFYRLYPDIDALLADRLSIDLDGQFAAAQESWRARGPSVETRREAIVYALRSVSARPKLYAAMLGGRGGENAVTIFRAQIARLITLYPPRSARVAGIPEDLRVAVIAGAVSGFLVSWLERDCTPAIDEATAMMETLLQSCW